MTQLSARSTAHSAYFWVGIVFTIVSVVLTLIAALGITAGIIYATGAAGLAALAVLPAIFFFSAGVIFIITASRTPTARQDATGTTGFAAHGLSFDVGVVERHRVDFAWDQMWGNATVTVDGVQLVHDLQMFSLSLVKTWDFPVGVTEVHQVRIEKHRPLLFSWARPQPLVAFVDGQFVARKD
jgi:hypothetical protein